MSDGPRRHRLSFVDLLLVLFLLGLTLCFVLFSPLIQLLNLCQPQADHLI